MGYNIVYFVKRRKRQGKMGKRVNYSVLNKGSSRNVLSLSRSDNIFFSYLFKILGGWVSGVPPPLLWRE